MSRPAGVARYLLELHDALDLSPPERVRAVAEVEEHLIDAVDHGIASGLDRDAAADRAIARLGTVEEVADAFRTEAGVHAAPYTLLHRFDEWRAGHIWLGAAASALPLLGAALAIDAMFGLLVSGAYGVPFRSTFLGPFIPIVLAAHCAGQGLVGHLLRGRPERTFSGRLRVARAERPLRYTLLLMVPYAIGWELGIVVTPNVRATLGNLLMPWVFVAIPLAGTLREKRPSLRLPRWSRPLLLLVAFMIPLLLTGALHGRLGVAAIAAASVYGGTFTLIRRPLQGRQVGPWVDALTFQAPLGLALLTLSTGSIGKISVHTVLFPIGLTAVLTPMLALNLRRARAEEQRKRLASAAAQPA